MKKFRDIVFKVDDAFVKVSLVCIALNMVLVTVSVVGRVLFNSPILGASDVVAFSFGLSCVFAFCITEKHKNHINIDLLMTILPVKGKLVNHAIMGTLNLITLAIIAVIFFRYIGNTYNNSMSSWVVHIPYYPFVAAAAIGMVLFFFTALANFLNAFDEIKNPEKKEVEKEIEEVVL